MGKSMFKMAYVTQIDQLEGKKPQDMIVLKKMLCWVIVRFIFIM